MLRHSIQLRNNASSVSHFVRRAYSARAKFCVWRLEQNCRQSDLPLIVGSPVLDSKVVRPDNGSLTFVSNWKTGIKNLWEISLAVWTKAVCWCTIPFHTFVRSSNLSHRKGSGRHWVQEEFSQAPHHGGKEVSSHKLSGSEDGQKEELSWVYLAKVKNFKDEKEIIAIAKTPGHRKNRKVIESLLLDWSIKVHSKPNLHQIG